MGIFKSLSMLFTSMSVLFTKILFNTPESQMSSDLARPTVSMCDLMCTELSDAPEAALLKQIKKTHQ